MYQEKTRWCSHQTTNLESAEQLPNKRRRTTSALCSKHPAHLQLRMASVQETSVSSAGADGAVEPEVEGIKRDQPAALVKMYHDPQFSDIKVFTGEDQRCFNLHRVILVANSKYFEIACKEHFEEGKTRETYLPDISSDIFEIVALWIYGGGFKYPDPFDKNVVQDVFIAADYLQILPLKNAVLTAVEDKFYRTDGWNPIDAYDMLETFCAHSKFTDWQKLRLLVKRAVHGCYMGPHRILRLSRNGEESSMMLGLVIEAYQNRMRGILCADCQGNNLRISGTGETCIGAYCNKKCSEPAFVNPFPKKM
ncbi:hypothetical protein TWF506_005847 [Arthrobotrys conoides]|uniref:BTB domain-containing protein n=1 Tax=Arthrobotrys conoides TaxID=74498 RepID=A0AAN8NK06_9PEZI